LVSRSFETLAIVLQSAACLRNSAGVSIPDLRIKSFNWEIADLVPLDRALAKAGVEIEGTTIKLVGKPQR
jgi:hypothetical protein